jgi:hypothetical protein
VNSHAWRPSVTEELLLAATVGASSGAAAAFAQWRATQPTDLIDEGSLRLLPLLVPRAALFPGDDAAWPIIRGVYRRAFFRGQLLARQAAEAITVLGTAGIPTLMLKGGALIAYYDDNPALRPMNDIDLLVPHHQAQAAMRAVLARQWTAGWPHPETLPFAYHGACFTSPDGFDIDLHWQPVASAAQGDDTPIWQRSHGTTLQGAATRAPCAADLLTIVCAHACQWSPVSPVRWVADALRIVEADEAGFDWERVLDSARRWHVTLQLGDTLAYLKDRWAMDVPPALLRGLACAPVAAVDRRAYAALARRPGLYAYLWRPWRRYRVRSRNLSPLRALPGFITYLQVTLGRTRVMQIPGEIARRALHFRKSRRLGRV